MVKFWCRSSDSFSKNVLVLNVKFQVLSKIRGQTITVHISAHLYCCSFLSDQQQPQCIRSITHQPPPALPLEQLLFIVTDLYLQTERALYDDRDKFICSASSSVVVQMWQFGVTGFDSGKTRRTKTHLTGNTRNKCAHTQKRKSCSNKLLVWIIKYLHEQ